MATPSDHLSRSENSLPDPEGPSEPDHIMPPSTPPMQHLKVDGYYNFPPARTPSNPNPHSEMSSSTTNISMQPNPMYQDFPPGIPLRTLNSEKQIVVEKIKEGNPDALSSSTLLENNVKIYERIDSFIPGRFLSRHSYSPEKKGLDPDYQFLAGATKENNPVKISGNITRICLQAFYSLLLIITLFIAVIALVISIICLVSISEQNAQQSQNISYRLEALDPLINMSSAHRLLVDDLARTRYELNILRMSSQQSFLALNETENCSLRESVCLVENRNQMCGTEPFQVGASDRITGVACVTSGSQVNDVKLNLVVNNQTGAYTCHCFITTVQDETWSCSLHMWVCNTP